MKIVEEHSDILPVWMGDGFNVRDLIIFDRHLDFKYVPDSRLALCERWARSPCKSAAPIRSLFFQDDHSFGWGIDDFLFVAQHLGVIGTITWIPTVESDLPELLQAHLDTMPYLSRGDVQSLEHGAKVTVQGRSLQVLRPEGLSSLIMAIPDVHVDFDIDYFLDHRETSHTVAEILERCPELKNCGSFSACYSITSGFTPESGRQLAEDLANQLGQIPEKIPLERERYPWSEKVLSGQKVFKEASEEANRMGPVGLVWQADLELMRGNPKVAVEKLAEAEKHGMRGLIPRYKLGLESLREKNYGETVRLLMPLLDPVDDTVCIRALRVILICFQRMGLEIPQDVIRIATEAVPHHRSIMKLINGRT